MAAPFRARPQASLRFRYDGREIAAAPGESVAAALLAADRPAQASGRAGGPRGQFCGMGVCHECLVVIDGRAGQRACLAAAADGLRVETQPPRLDLADPALRDLCAVPRAIGTREAEILVVGAGPAGLAAAAAAAEAGARVLVIDERPGPGGQYYKQPRTAAARARDPDRQSREGRALIARVRALGVAIAGDTLLWGAERDEEDRLTVAVMGGDGVLRYRPRRLIVATGAYEEPPPVPGWTLPGVMTTGAAQTLLRSYGVVPGRRVLVAGNGPLNLQVAAELIRAGAEAVAVAEAAPSPFARPREAAALLAAHPALAWAGLRHWALLRGAGVDIAWGHDLLRLEGSARVEAAVIGSARGERRIAVDAVLLGRGFAPSSELPRLLGCAYRGEGAGLRIERDEDGATSRPDVYVAGEAGRFAGAHVALAQGRLAGIAAARGLGLSPPMADAALRRRLRRHEAFQGALWRLFSPARPAGAPGDDTLACRCEAVAFGALRHAVEAGGARDMATLKRLTRAGMGRCQGRYCGPALRALAQESRAPGRKADAVFLAPQMPLRPVPLAALAVEKPEWGGHRRVMLPDRPLPDAPAPFAPMRAGTLVIGAGIAGLSTALFLARAGEDVVVVDRAVPNALASGGNAGSLHAQLLSFDHGARAEGGGGPAAETLPLQRDAIALWGELQRELGTDFEMRVTGGLMVAESEGDLRFLEAKTALERRYGVECRVIDAAALARLEPALDRRFVGAAHCPAEGKINPLLATQAVLEAGRRAGIRLVTRAEVRAVARGGEGFTVTTSAGTISARRLVNAAGAFASRIGAMLGRPVPVFGAPLQMAVTEAAEPLVSCLVAHADRHLTLKQAANGSFIIGGGWTAALDPVRQHPRPLLDSLEGNLWVAQHVVPALRKLHLVRSWAAMNINIDGAPILGEHPGEPGFFTAVTSNGYTLGPLVGRLTAELVTGRRGAGGLEPFSIARFAGGRA
ncbi:D-amino acid dehydrogenase [Methylobacterium crusticola]|uniref:D-amino acid dehydrogenase n=1 Tax=Methylobacterium crusticola TaxID=1697972 RepID=A0ABQ4QW78_9HYPH|nr:FAD-dependent oxidoreductase [Methylobacterium crusticola]GJD49613.1 D-amino acid dehydrogenase [Methylobacterium crusticola]